MESKKTQKGKKQSSEPEDLYKFQEEKLTVVMNSHNTRQAAQYAERIIGLRQGVVVKDAAASDWDEEAFAAVYGGTK